MAISARSSAWLEGKDAACRKEAAEAKAAYTGGAGSREETADGAAPLPPLKTSVPLGPLRAGPSPPDGRMEAAAAGSPPLPPPLTALAASLAAAATAPPMPREGGADSATTAFRAPGAVTSLQRTRRSVAAPNLYAKQPVRTSAPS